MKLYQKMVVLRLYFEKLTARTALMNGKILGNGVISGNDGKRYHFEPSDIKNLDGRDISQLSGKEVDFVAQDDKASEIFITQSAGLNINTQNIRQIFSSSNLTTIKTLMFISIALTVFGNIALNAEMNRGFVVFWYIFSSAAFIYASYLIKKVAHSNIILISAVAAEICLILGNDIFIGEYNTLAIIFILIYFEFRRRYYCELALLTSQWLFKLRVYIYGAWTLFYIIAIYYYDTEIINNFIIVISYTGLAVSLIAWIKTQKIENKANI